MAFDVSGEDLSVGSRPLRLWRPAHPPDVHDPDAERGTAGPVWAQTWTSGAVLAEIVASCSLHGVRVLELGCGLGLVGIAAAQAGARVTVNDRSHLALAFAAVNAQENGLAVETIQCEWQNPAPLEADGPYDLVLGSDILYDERSAYALLGLLDRVVGPGGEAWITDPGRQPAAAFIAAASSSWRLSKQPCGHGVLMHRFLRPSGAGHMAERAPTAAPGIPAPTAPTAR